MAQTDFHDVKFSRPNLPAGIIPGIVTKLSNSKRMRETELVDLEKEERENLLSTTGNVQTIDVPVKDVKAEPTIREIAFDFIFCAASLQVSYVLWGLMQEEIMTTKFKPTPSTPTGHFPSATFCVLSNRLLAIVVSALCCLYFKGTTSSAAPLLSFTPCAISNTLSSWGQYQALEFVGFSLQTIFKSMKIIPVMLMGILLKGTKYRYIEFGEALGITIGIVIFSLSKSNFVSNSVSNQVIGFLLLSLYIASDSFTSQWQSRIYRDYGKIEHYQMMFGVNLSAIVITLLALIVSGEIPIIMEFFWYNPAALWYNVVTAITSTTGQFAIFYTIKRFGPDVFTVIMTTRQMISIVVSNYLFNHKMSMQSYVGSFIVFSVLAYSIRRKILEKQANDATKAAAAPALAAQKPSEKS